MQCMLKCEIWLTFYCFCLLIWVHGTSVLYIYYNDLCAFQMLESGVVFNSCLQLYCNLMASFFQAGLDLEITFFHWSFKHSNRIFIVLYTRLKKELKKLLVQRASDLFKAYEAEFQIYLVLYHFEQLHYYNPFI